MFDTPKIYLIVLARDCLVNSQLALKMCIWSQQADKYHLGCTTIVENRRTLEAARNQGVEWFLETDCTHLLFVDHDIIPPVEAPIELLAADKDVVSPLCFLMQYQKGKIYPFSASSRMRTEEERQPGQHQWFYYWGKELERVDAVTGGCMLIKRHVLEAIGPRPFIASHSDNGARISINADFGFAVKCAEHGFEHWTDYRIVTDHAKQVSLAAVVGRIIENNSHKVCVEHPLESEAIA